MSRLAGRTKTHQDAKLLINYMRDDEFITVTRLVRDSEMSQREIYDALQYCVRHGVIARELRQSTALNQRVLYRLTGLPLPGGKVLSGPSFDALLTAWGIARVPPPLPAILSTRRVATD